MTRLLRRTGALAARVDPYWDFERDGGHDEGARRYERLRVVVPGSEPREVRLRLARVERGTLIDLPLAEHVFRFLGGAPSDSAAYAPALPRFACPPPHVAIALDLTALAPGDHVLSAAVPGREVEELRVTIERRPFFTWPPELGDARPAVRSATGLGRALHGGDEVPATAHRWRLARHAWSATGLLRGRYAIDGAVDVAAVTVFAPDLAPIATRFRELAPGEVLDADALVGPAGLSALRAPRDHADASRGYGLAFPELLGLRTQPGPDGAHGLR